jgi:hypothetical protein
MVVPGQSCQDRPDPCFNLDARSGEQPVNASAFMYRLFTSSYYSNTYDKGAKLVTSR